MKLPPVESLPRFLRSELANGLRLQVARRGPIPLVSVRLVIEAGSAADPAGKAGLADLYGELLRRGTEKFPGGALDDAVERLGGTLKISTFEDFLSVSVSAPSEHLARMLEVVAQMAAAPELTEAEFEMGRRRVVAQLANDLDEPSEVAERALQAAVWGSVHPYGHEASGRRAELDSLAWADVLGFRRERVGPKVTTLVVVGDVDPEEVQERAAAGFADFRGGPAQAPVPETVDSVAFRGKVVIVDRPEQTQTQVRLGAMGIGKGHVDYFAVSLANAVLGGSFTSRLMKEIRVKRGLSYGASSTFDKLRGQGSFTAKTFTKTESTRTVIDVLLSTIRTLRERGPSSAEIESSQRYLAGTFPARVETNEALTLERAVVAAYGLSEDFLEEWQRHLLGTSRAEVIDAGRRHLPEAEAMVVLLVGRASELVPQVRDLGEVVVLNTADVA